MIIHDLRESISKKPHLYLDPSWINLPSDESFQCGCQDQCTDQKHATIQSFSNTLLSHKSEGAIIHASI